MRPLKIESSDNARFKSWKQCLKASGIEKTGQFLLSGQKIVAEELKNRPEMYTDLLWPAGALDVAQATDTVGGRFLEGADIPDHLRIIELSKELFHELNELGTPGPILVGNKPEWDITELNEPPQGLEIMLALQDPGNVGAALRSALAFGAKKVILLGDCAHPLLPRALKASSGASLRLNIERGPLFIALPKEAQSYLTALDLHGEELATYKWPKDVRLILGEEGQGFPAGFEPAKKLTISMARELESLNAAVALGIALYSYRHQNL